MQAAGIYKWTDQHGKVHFSDQPPPETQVEEIKLRINSYTTPPIIRKLAAEGFASSVQQVVLYSTEWCGVCKRAKAYFQSKDVRYTEYDVEKSRKGRDDYRRLNGQGVPIILVGDQRMDGFNPARFEGLLKRASARQ